MNNFINSIFSAGGSAKRMGVVPGSAGALLSGAATGSLGSQLASLTDIGFRPSSNGARQAPFDFGIPGAGSNGPLGLLPGLHPAQEVNPRIIPFGRRYSSISGRDFAPPGENELALTYNTFPDAPNASYSGIGTMLGNGFTLQGTPALATALAQWNFILAELQIRWRQKHEPGYQALTPQHLWWGMRNLADQYAPDDPAFQALQQLDGYDTYDGWSIDGVVRATTGADGSAPQRTHGMRADKAGALGNGRGIVRNYEVTVTARGAQSMLDIFEGRGIVEGARCYLVLRKFAVDAYQWADPDKQTRLQYHLATKAIDLTRDADMLTRNVETFAGDDAKPVQLYQLAAVASPSGAPLDRDYKRYVDEWGVTRFDGLLLEVGRVFSAPIRYTYQGPPAPDAVKPYMNSRDTMKRDFFEAIVNPDDGFRSTN